MSFSVVGSVNHLISEYRRFLLSTYRLADQKLRDQFEDQIQQTDVQVKGPYVTLSPSWCSVAGAKDGEREGLPAEASAQAGVRGTVHGKEEAGSVMLGN